MSRGEEQGKRCLMQVVKAKNVPALGSIVVEVGLGIVHVHGYAGEYSRLLRMYNSVTCFTWLLVLMAGGQ